jgi:hypothetical protein
MKFFQSKPDWFVAGLSFDCAGCGGCCAGPEEGYVWVNREEIDAIAAYLGINLEQTREDYIRSVGLRNSLRERDDNNDCIFLAPPGPDDRGCRIYPVRPMQCRTWPFWPSNLHAPEAWASAGRRCKGINCGQVHPFEEIQSKRNATRE